MDTYPILCGYVSTEYPKKKKKKIGYWGRYVLTAIAHYRIRFGQRDGGGCGCQGRRKGVGAVDGGWIRRPRRTACGSSATADDGWIRRPRRTTCGSSATADGGWIRQLRRTACGSGGRDGRTPFPCVACGPQLAARVRSLDPWRRALSLARERELTRERERCGHATLGEKKKCDASAVGT
jgi:hypothetical protein